METVVFCKKYQEELPAMSFPPLPGPAGKDLMETVSQKAFEAWKLHQTTLINERRLDLSVPESRTFLIEEMHKFFDNQEVAQAEGFVEPTKDSGIQTYTPPPAPLFDD
jgi:Fe-S cluster biosynthesis and repair protein YggX